MYSLIADGGVGARPALSIDPAGDHPVALARRYLGVHTELPVVDPFPAHPLPVHG